MDAIDLYDGPAPGSEDWTHSEQRYFSEALGIEVMTNVVVPTLTPVLPSPGTANGAAVVIAPGGAFHLLSIGSEGFEVAERLAGHGIAVGIYHPGWVRTDMGGTGADIAVDAAADGLMARFDALSLETTGRFQTWDGRAHPY